MALKAILMPNLNQKFNTDQQSRLRIAKLLKVHHPFVVRSCFKLFAFVQLTTFLIQ